VVDVAAPDAQAGIWTLGVRPATEELHVRRSVLAATAATDLDLTSVRPLTPSLEELYRRAVERFRSAAAAG
jgi:hypothetical protein